MSKFRILSVILLLFVSILLLAPGGAGAADPVGVWPDLYDPFVLRHIDLQMSDGDWNTIVNDATYDIEVPAQLSIDGDAGSVLVSVRRKSATKLGADKVSLKVDINEYHDDNVGCVGFPGQTCVEEWHGVKKLSLENGDDNNVVTEGLAWYLNRMAAESNLDYTSGHASWVTVSVNGDNKGVYVNVEQRDKTFLKNHGLWEGGDETWLYKYSEINDNDREIKVGPQDETIDSPLYNELCYLPFRNSGFCSTPDDFKDRLNAKINMEGLLTYGAVAAFMGSSDDLYSKGKNYYFVDYLTPAIGLREYVQWDLDSAFNGNKPDASIYNQGKGRSDVYEEALVEASDAPFREEYDAVFHQLLNDPFTEANLFPAFDMIEAAIGEEVDADDFNQMGQNSASTFANLKQYVTDRRASALIQLPDPTPDPDPPLAAFTYADNYLAVDFTDASTGTIDSWSWDFGDGNSSTEANPSHPYAAAGTYPVSLTVTNAAGSSTASQSITVSVQPAPVADFTYQADYLTVDFTDASSGTIDSWSWVFGDGNSSTEANPSHPYAAAGTYPVSLTVTNAGGSNTATQSVTVTAPPPPTADFSFTTSDLTANFTDLSCCDVTSWIWDFGDGNSSTAANPSHTYTLTGNYNVTLAVANAAGSSAPVSILVTVTAPPAPVAAFTYLANNLTVDFTDASTGTIDSWSWDFGDGNGSVAQNPSHTYAAGTYTVSLTVTNAADSDTTSQSISVTVPVDPTLTAIGFKVKGVHHADLLWSNFTAPTVDISRDGTFIIRVPNNGSYTDRIGGKGGWDYPVYEVCDTDSNPRNCATATASAP